MRLTIRVTYPVDFYPRPGEQGIFRPVLTQVGAQRQPCQLNTGVNQLVVFFMIHH